MIHQVKEIDLTPVAYDRVKVRLEAFLEAMKKHSKIKLNYSEDDSFFSTNMVVPLEPNDVLVVGDKSYAVFFSKEKKQGKDVTTDLLLKEHKKTLINEFSIAKS